MTAEIGAGVLMVPFWGHAFWRMVVNSFALVGKDLSDIVFSVLVFVVGAILLCIREGTKNGWNGVKMRFWKIMQEDALIVCALFSLVLVYHFLREPYMMWNEEVIKTSSADLEKNRAQSAYTACDKERAVDDTLAKSCASSLAFQQSRNDGQQDLFNRCLLELGLKNKPVPVTVSVSDAMFAGNLGKDETSGNVMGVMDTCGCSQSRRCSSERNLSVWR